MKTWCLEFIKSKLEKSKVENEACSKSCVGRQFWPHFETLLTHVSPPYSPKKLNKVILDITRKMKKKREFKKY